MTIWPAATLIRAKRDGRVLDANQWRDIARGIADGSWADAQVGALAMAIAWRGLEIGECREFTFALRDSGRTLDWRDLPGPALDKHSTGGVGDCVSLLLAPLVAACGGYVPMISGRGLGHTGGTLDKLESLPGYDVHPAPTRLVRVVAEARCAIVGQSDDLVPADRRLYALRDVTGTVDVPDLIVASILSKKLAGGASAVVLDIKVGNGAQTPRMADATALARRMQEVARGTGIELRAALGDMDQVPGREAGNALEIRAAIDVLCRRAVRPRLLATSLALAAELLRLGRLASSLAEAEARLQRALDSGAAAERFARMVSALGGPADILEHPERHLPRAPVQRAVPATASGFVATIDVRALGECVVDLGGGRRKPGAPVDHAVGLAEVRGRGEHVTRGDALAVIHARTDAAADAVAPRVHDAFTLAANAPPDVPAVRWLPVAPACTA